jgi:hypothetical protein
MNNNVGLITAGDLHPDKSIPLNEVCTSSRAFSAQLVTCSLLLPSNSKAQAKVLRENFQSASR